jgi:hypothetical protein
MATSYGLNSRVLTSADVTVLNYGGTILQNEDIDGALRFSYRHDLPSCGEPRGSAEFYLRVNPSLGKFTYLSYTVSISANTAACWSFNQGDSSGGVGYTNSLSIPQNGGCLSYSQSLDPITFASNCFELPQYTKQMAACDNDNSNYMRFAVVKSFTVRRRINSTAASFGVWNSRGCHDTNGTVTISNIFVS